MARRVNLARLLERREGSPEAKRRAELLIEASAGKRDLVGVARELGVNEARAHVLRDRLFQAALEALEPRTPGRKPREEPAEEERIAELEHRVAELEREKEAFEVREALRSAGVVRQKKRR